MSKIFLWTIGFCLITLAAALTLSRMGADGAYWLISSHNAYSSGGMYVQQPDEGQRHMMHGFDHSMSFLWWSDAWLYFRTVEAFNADFYSLYLYRMRVGSRQRECVGRKLALLGADPLSDFTPAPESEWVAFATPEGEPNRVYVSRAGCANPTRVFDSQTDVVNSLFWSPDGEWLYIHTHHESVNRSHLYRVHADGSGFTLLTETHAERYQTDKSWQWSPDGEWVLLRACGIIDINFYILCSLHTFRADGDEYSQIRHDLRANGPVIWTDDSQWVILADERERPGNVDVYRISRNGSITENISRLDGDVLPYGMTPDLQWTIFSVNDGAGQSLYGMRPDGSHQRLLFDGETAGSTIDVEAFVGEWIYISEYDFDTPLQTRLLRLRPDGSEVQHLALGGFARNRWHLSPDGQSLLTTYGDGNASPARLFRVNVDGSQPENIPMESYYEPSAVSPLINLPWRAGFLVLTGLVMLALGMSFRVILTKVPQLFGIE
jgi:hypothetical protein